MEIARHIEAQKARSSNALMEELDGLEEKRIKEKSDKKNKRKSSMYNYNQDDDQNSLKHQGSGSCLHAQNQLN